MISHHLGHRPLRWITTDAAATEGHAELAGDLTGLVLGERAEGVGGPVTVLVDAVGEQVDDVHRRAVYPVQSVSSVGHRDHV